MAYSICLTNRIIDISQPNLNFPLIVSDYHTLYTNCHPIPTHKLQTHKTRQYLHSGSCNAIQKTVAVAAEREGSPAA